MPKPDRQLLATKNMPNLILSRADSDDVIAYILSLKGTSNNDDFVVGDLAAVA
jgi:hypothetical protein